MKKDILKIFVIFIITVGVVFWALNALYFNSTQKSKASGETMALTFTPSSTTAGVNSDFTVSIMAKPSINTIIRGYKTRVNFDKDKVKLKAVQYKIGQVVQDLGQTTADVAAINSAAFGQVNLVGEVVTSTGANLPTAGAELVSLTFTNVSTSGTILLINESAFYTVNSDMSLYDGWTTTQENLVVNSGGVLVTGTLTDTVTGAATTSVTAGASTTVTQGATISVTQATTLTVTQGVTTTVTTIPVTGNTVLNLKLKFQGIKVKPVNNSMVVKVKVTGGALTAPIEKSGTFTADDNGVWSGSVGFDATVSTVKYTVFIKGPKHLQKKVCDTTPSETSPGIYRCSNGNISLATGNNALDFSNILLLSGDIYGPDKAQDGLVTSIDISYIKNNLNKNDSATLAVCDINLDGKCDTQDYSLVINALLIKTDEQ